MINDWTPLQRWRYAIKPGSWPKLLVPMFLGQALGVALSGGFSVWAMCWGLAFTILDGLFIVLLNDWGDRDVDAIKRARFPDGCSPKTIPDGILPAQHLLAGGLLAGVGLAGVGWIGERWLHEGLFAAALLSLAIFIAYTFAPVKANYRGGGELLEMFGVGLVLPAANALAQGGGAWSPLHTVLVGFTSLSLASALASGLSDEESDREGGKRTFTTAFGNGATRAVVAACVVLGAALWLLAGLAYDAVPLWPAVAAAAVVAFFGRRVWASGPAAVTNAFGPQKVYKMHLHHAIWYGALTLGFGILIDTFATIP